MSDSFRNSSDGFRNSLENSGWGLKILEITVTILEMALQISQKPKIKKPKQPPRAGSQSIEARHQVCHFGQLLQHVFFKGLFIFLSLRKNGCISWRTLRYSYMVGSISLKVISYKMLKNPIEESVANELLHPTKTYLQPALPPHRA